jgi:hypothetical protein
MARRGCSLNPTAKMEAQARAEADAKPEARGTCRLPLPQPGIGPAAPDLPEGVRAARSRDAALRPVPLRGHGCPAESRPPA